MLIANRPPPLWQGIDNHRTLKPSVACVAKVLAKRERISISWGWQPEAGDARLNFWKAGSALRSNPDLIVTFHKGPTFTAVHMDADARRNGEQIWRAMRSACRITQLG